MKKNILKGEAKQTKNIKFDDYNTTNPVNLNKNRIVKKNRSNKILSSTFIDKKRKDNNDLEKKLNKTVVERKKKDNKDLGKIEVENFHTKIEVKKNKPKINERNSQANVGTSNTNYATNRNNNKKELEIKSNKVLETEVNYGLPKPKVRERINKSIDKIRPRNSAMVHSKLESFNTAKNKKKKK